MAGIVNSWFPGSDSDAGQYDTITYPVNTSATFVAGDFVIYSTGLTAAAAAGSNYSPSSATLYGWAISPAIDPEFGLKTSLQIVKAKPGSRVWLPIWNATPASAVWNPNLIGGAGYELHCVAAGVWGVDIGTQTHPVVRILQPSAGIIGDVPLWPNSTAATTTPLYPYVECEFIGGICALTGAR